jgi:hypothetical protein
VKASPRGSAEVLHVCDLHDSVMDKAGAPVLLVLLLVHEDCGLMCCCCCCRRRSCSLLCKRGQKGKTTMPGQSSHNT